MHKLSILVEKKMTNDRKTDKLLLEVENKIEFIKNIKLQNKP
jgi:hypothetical protein